MRASSLWVPFLLFTIAGCGERTERVDAPTPVGEFTPEPDSLPSLPPGTIVAPLSLDLDGAIRALEAEVPRRFGNITQRLPFEGSRRKSYAFEVTREPFSVGFAADTVLLSATTHYQGRAWYDPPIGPDLNGECGTRGEQPRARLVVRAVPRLTSSWTLAVKMQLDKVVPLTDTERDQCEVSFLKLDVTGKVLEGASRALERILPRIEQQLSRIDIRTPLTRIWADLQKPIRLTDSLWLLLAPTAVNLGRMQGSRRAVEAEIGVTASPRFVTGAKPIFRPLPLPPLGTVRTDPGFALLVEGAFDYSVMSAELTQRLAGKSVRVGGSVIRVERVTMLGLGGGRLAIGLDFEGSARGRLWLLGRPSYDATTGMLSVPDLDFDARSANLLVKGIAWLKGNEIREFLRKQATISAGPVLGQMQALAIKEMNQEIEPGVALSATIESSEPAGIAVRAGGLVIRARATGAARLSLGPQVFEPKRPAGR